MLRPIHLCTISLVVFIAGLLQAWGGELAPDQQILLGKDALVIKNWTLVGPFIASEETDVWSHDFIFQSLGIAERKVRSVRELDAMPPAYIKSTGAGPYNITERKFLDFHYILDRPNRANLPPTAVYVATSIIADDDTNAFLMFGCSQALRVWVNGLEAITSPIRRSTSTYDESTSIRLLKGRNFLLFKVVGWARNNWGGLTAAIAPSSETAAALALEGQGMLESLLLHQSVLAPKDRLKLEARGVPASHVFNASITDSEGRLIRTCKLGGENTAALAGLENGLYQLRVTISGKEYGEKFCLGNPTEVLEELSLGSRSEIQGREWKYNEETRRSRINELLKPSAMIFASEGARRNWERKIVHALYEYRAMQSVSTAKLEEWKSSGGLHILAFQSKIDEQVQHYRIFLPNDQNRKSGGPLPLVVMLPTVLSANRPFLMSPFVAAHSEAERISKIAEKSGFAVLWPGYRNQPMGAPCEFTHFDEVIENVRQYCNIDLSRIFLMGACSGGAIATRFALEWPQRFAGIAILNPVFTLKKTSSAVFRETFARNIGFNKWNAKTDVVYDFLRLDGPSTYIVHDGTAEQGHGELKVAQHFAAVARKTGFPLQFEQVEQTLGQHFGAWEQMFEWVSGRSNSHYSSEPTVSQVASSTEVGSVSEVFSKKFIVVTATGGTAFDRDEMGGIVRKFRDAWRQTHFVDCVVVSDVEYKKSPVLNANLVLLGRPETNAVWADLRASCPVDVTPGRLVLGDLAFESDHLSYQFVIRNPFSASHRIVFLGSQRSEDGVFPTMNLSVDGWFGYAVYSVDNQSASLVAAGSW